MTAADVGLDVGYRQDQDLWPVLEELAACLCRELADSGLPETCICGVFPGAQVPLDYAEQGMAAVRLVNVFPFTSFPQAEQRVGRTCGALLGAQVEVSVFRCAPLPEVDGVDVEFPTMVEQWEATRLQLADMAAMHRAIVCCAGSDTVIGSYSPYGPAGGVVGGTWTVYVPQAGA